MENLKFSLTIEGAFCIAGQVAVIGMIEKGEIKEGDTLELIGGNDYDIVVKCIRIEQLRKLVREAKEGESAGLFLLGVSRSEVRKGMKLIIPK